MRRLSTILFQSGLGASKNENRKDYAANCGGGGSGRLVHIWNGRAKFARAIEHKAKTAVLRRDETGYRFKEAHGEICSTRGRVAWGAAREQGRMGTACRGCRERRNAL